VRNIFLIATREYRQIASTRGFWVMLLVLPIVIAVAQVAGRFFGPQLESAYVIVDESGAYDTAIDRRLTINYQRIELSAFSAYAQRWGLGAIEPDAVWARGERWFTDQQIDQFIAQGGIVAAAETVRASAPPEAPSYEIDPPGYVRAQIPDGVNTQAGPDRLAADLAPWLAGEIPTAQGKRPLTLAVYIPAVITSDTPVRMWTNGAPNNTLIDNVRNEITRVMRATALSKTGLEQKQADAIADMSAPITLSAPPQGAGREQLVIRSALPLAMVYLLLVTVLTTGSMMLQGIIEERSNKLLESVLATVHPFELMHGKLLGLGAIGLTILGVWVAAAVGAALSIQGVVADIVKPSLAAIEPWMFAAIFFYFIAGYVIISILYLAIGALSNSLQDAQSYLTPVIMLIMLPVMFMMVSVAQQADGLFAVIMSWIPFYTPFAMLARMGAGVSVIEVLATGAMLAAFVVIEMILLGRLFQASLLRTGQPPRLGAFLAIMFAKQGS